LAITKAQFLKNKVEFTLEKYGSEVQIYSGVTTSGTYGGYGSSSTTETLSARTKAIPSLFLQSKVQTHNLGDIQNKGLSIVISADIDVEANSKIVWFNEDYDLISTRKKTLRGLVLYKILTLSRRL